MSGRSRWIGAIFVSVAIASLLGFAAAKISSGLFASQLLVCNQQGEPVTVTIRLRDAAVLQVRVAANSVWKGKLDPPGEGGLVADIGGNTRELGYTTNGVVARYRIEIEPGDTRTDTSYPDLFSRLTDGLLGSPSCD
jgi:hypothetical protein